MINMILPDIEKLKSLVKTAAQEILLKDFGHSESEYKEDGSIVTPADIAMQDRLETELKHHWPMYGILGEEMTEGAQLAVIEQATRNKTVVAHGGAVSGRSEERRVGKEC